MQDTKQSQTTKRNATKEPFASPLRDKLAMTDKAITAKPDESVRCRLHYKKVRTSVDLDALSDIYAGLRSSSILGGNPAKADADGFSYWAAEPKEIFEFRYGQEQPFGKLQKTLDKYRLELDQRPQTEDQKVELPKGVFRGGWIGYFSYDLGRYIEPSAFSRAQTTIDEAAMPLIRLCFYDKFICYDHTEGAFRLIALEIPGDVEKPGEKLAELEELLAKSEQTRLRPPAPADLEDIDLSQTRCNMDKDYYMRTVEKIKRYIYDGEVYQINFSQRFECEYEAKAIELYHWQNRYNPSGYAAYIDCGDFQIVSASPEMFITIDDGVISTKPIKGTRRRIDETGSNGLQVKQINTKNFKELLTSEKERAELNMIIDLERNDVARICRPGSRTVVQPRTIETYPTVYHAVATVGGRLRDDITFCDILKAMFPGGSITGAPKIRSMEIIEETEPAARGVYTGSIGFLGIDGNVCLNIAIRTVIIAAHKAYTQTGGGIVADSDAQAEWQETITKARALLAGINSVQRAAGNERIRKT